MNSSSKVIMAATMVMVVSLVMVLSLVLVLLAELYFSLLLRRRRNHSLTLPTTTTTISAATTPTTTTLNQVISSTNEETSPSHIDSSTNPLYTGVIQTPTKTHFSNPSLDLIHEPIVNDSKSNHDNSTASVDDFIYISNPIYSNESTTPFETPQSSPSHLETGENSSSGEEDSDIITEEDSTPTLTPMKDLPEMACSISLKEVETSSSECNRDGCGSSSSSVSPYTSPSW